MTGLCNRLLVILAAATDTRFTAAFDDDLTASGIDVRLAPIQSPNTQAFVERSIPSIKQECLDHFVLLGERHVNHIANSWIYHYHVERPHQGEGKHNEPLIAFKFPESAEGKVCRKTRLGGLIKRYYCKAA